MMPAGLRRAAIGAVLCVVALPAFAAEYPAPKEGDYVAKDFRFHTGEVMPEVKLHYTTIGEPAGQPVLVLHGTAGSARSMLTPAFAGELFGAGQPLDATKYFIILPDALGAGKSSKPSDGLKAKFPRYNYDDMVAGAVSPGHRRPRHQAPAPGHRQFDGRHAHLACGARRIPISWTRWCRWRRSRPRCRAATG